MAISYPLLIMLAPGGEQAAPRWMADARTAAAMDLWSRLSNVESIDVVVDAADPVDREAFQELGAQVAVPADGPFHFGRRIDQLCSVYGWKRLAYFGGASAPLLTEDALSAILEQAIELEPRAGLVNNLHSSDWLVINDTSPLSGLIERLPKDNMLGWVLSQDAGFQIRAMPPETAFRADLDTPADVLMIGKHPHAGDRLSEFARRSGGPLMTRIEALESALLVPGNGLAVIGRASSRLWSRLESELPIWVRSYVEERGMVSSGRLAEGSVKSLVAAAVEVWGAEKFVGLLSELVQAVVWDTRVWMAHRGGWPSESDRWSADLGWLDQIEDGALSELTRAILSAPIPIVTGGQGVVGGSMMALLDGPGSGNGDYQPSR